MSIYVYNFDTKFDDVYVRKLNPLEEFKMRRYDKYGIVERGKILYLKDRNDDLAMEIIKKHLNNQIIKLNTKINRFKRKIELCNNSDNIKILNEHSYNEERYKFYLLRESMLKNSK
jgi:hypothetical protein